MVLPDDLRGFGCLDGVWVSDLQSWPALAVALREQLTRVAFAHAASRGKNEKMELLYRYLAGDQFRQRVLGIVEAFTGMQAQLARERRAMEKSWREREKQIERVMTNTVSMYGEMRGLIGASMPQIRALELDDGALADEGAAATRSRAGAPTSMASKLPAAVAGPMSGSIVLTPGAGPGAGHLQEIFFAVVDRAAQFEKAEQGVKDMVV